MITYSPFWKLLSDLCISQYRLIHKHHISPSQLDRLKRDLPVSTETIRQLCTILHCQVSDIMSYEAIEPAY